MLKHDYLHYFTGIICWQSFTTLPRGAAMRKKAVAQEALDNIIDMFLNKLKHDKDHPNVCQLLLLCSCYES